MFSKTILFFLFVLSVVSCAQVSTKKQAESRELSQIEIELLNVRAVARVSDRLRELSIAAKASGPDKVKFLGSDMYLKASAAMMEGDYATANLIFGHLVKLEPHDEFIKTKYAVSLIRTGELAQAESILAKMFKDSKGRVRDPNIGLVLAGVYAGLGKIKQSRRVYSSLLRANPRNEEACIFLGKSYAIGKNTKKAIKVLKRCERRDLVKGKGKRLKKKAIYSYYMGKIFLDKKYFKTARKYFLRSTKLDKNFSQAVLALGVVYEELGKWKKAKLIYKKYLRKNKDDILVLSKMVQLLFTKEKFKEVIPYAERLSDYEPENLNLKVKLGILYTDVKMYSKAIRTFKDLLLHAPKNDKILYYLAAIYQESKQFELAINNFNKISEGSGLYQDSSLQIAQMLSSLAKVEELDSSKVEGRFQEKFLSFVDNRIKKFQVLKVDFSVIKASYFENLERTEKAISALESVKDDTAFNNDHRFYLASLYEKEGFYKKSIDVIEQVLDRDPSNAHAWNFLGYSMLERSNDMAKAFEYISKAVKLKPNDGYIRDSLGWYHFKNGNMAKAIKELKKAVKQVPEDIAINKHLAIVYTKKKNFKKAKFYIKKALSHAKSDSDKTELNTALKELEQKRIPASFQSLK